MPQAHKLKFLPLRVKLHQRGDIVVKFFELKERGSLRQGLIGDMLIRILLILRHINDRQKVLLEELAKTEETRK